MANRFFTPNQQFADATGLPYGSGSLLFYASGTSTPLNTYSDKALTIANLNPVVLDSAGRAGNIFLQNLAYKVILCSDSLGLVPVWTADPVYSSDFSTTASFLSGAGSPNGNTAGTQGSSTIPASVYWDTTNNILYVCTTTGTTTTAVWTAVNASTAAAVVLPPQGFLTPLSGTPVITTDFNAVTVLYYTPDSGNLVPIYNGSSFIPTIFTELTLTLSSSHVANNIYDCFVFNNSGVPVLVTGPSWTGGSGGSITPGSCARGTGAGGTALAKINGTNTNAVQITGRNGATTYTINANLATYVGSIWIDATNGQVSLHRTYGQNRKFGIWNASFNRRPIILQAGDGAGAWQYNSTIRASNNAPAAYSSTVFNVGSGTACNGGSIFQGLAEEEADIRFEQSVTIGLNANAGTVHIYVGINSISASSGRIGNMSSFSAGVGTSENDLIARGVLAPTLGITNFCALESGSATGVLTFLGSTAGMIISASYRG